MFDLPSFFQKEIILEFSIDEPSMVTVELLDEQQSTVEIILSEQVLPKGKQKITIKKSTIKEGRYWAKIYILNTLSKIMRTEKVLVR